MGDAHPRRREVDPLDVTEEEEMGLDPEGVGEAQESDQGYREEKEPFGSGCCASRRKTLITPALFSQPPPRPPGEEGEQRGRSNRAPWERRRLAGN